MTKQSITPKRGKKKGAKPRVAEALVAAPANEDLVPWSVKGPVYGAAAAMWFLYSWGAMASYSMVFAVGLIGLFALGEFVKAPLGEMLGEAIDMQEHKAQLFLCVLVMASVSIGTFGGNTAINAAAAPRERYEALMFERTQAEDRVDRAQQALDAVPVCTPEMPASRCTRLTESNADRVADATERRAQAQERLDLAIAAVDSEEDPGTGIPANIRDGAKWGAMLIELLIFGVPLLAAFLKRRRMALDAQPAPKEGAAAVEPVKPAPVELTPSERASRLASSGWEGERGEKRRKEMQQRMQKRYGHLRAVT